MARSICANIYTCRLKSMSFLNNRLRDIAISLQLTFNGLFQERVNSQKILRGF